MAPPPPPAAEAAEAAATAVVAPATASSLPTAAAAEPGASMQQQQPQQQQQQHLNDHHQQQQQRSPSSSPPPSPAPPPSTAGAHHLLALPEHVLLSVLQRVGDDGRDIASLCAAGRACTSLAELAAHPSVWPASPRWESPLTADVRAALARYLPGLPPQALRVEVATARSRRFQVAVPLHNLRRLLETPDSEGLAERLAARCHARAQREAARLFVGGAFDPAASVFVARADGSSVRVSLRADVVVPRLVAFLAARLPVAPPAALLAAPHGRGSGGGKGDDDADAEPTARQLGLPQPDLCEVGAALYAAGRAAKRRIWLVAALNDIDGRPLSPGADEPRERLQVLWHGEGEMRVAGRRALFLSIARHGPPASEGARLTDAEAQLRPLVGAAAAAAFAPAVVQLALLSALENRRGPDAWQPQLAAAAKALALLQTLQHNLAVDKSEAAGASASPPALRAPPAGLCAALSGGIGGGDDALTAAWQLAGAAELDLALALVTTFAEPVISGDGCRLSCEELCHGLAVLVAHSSAVVGDGPHDDAVRALAARAAADVGAPGGDVKRSCCEGAAPATLLRAALQLRLLQAVSWLLFVLAAA